MQGKGENNYLVLFDSGAKQKVNADQIQIHGEFINMYIKGPNGSTPLVATFPSAKVSAVIEVTNLTHDDNNWVNP